MEKIFILVASGILFVFTFSTISIKVIRLSGKNYKEENRWKLRMLTVSNLLIMLMYIGMAVILSK